MQLNNYELSSFCRRVRRYTEEIHGCSSADGPLLYDGDKDNFISFMDALDDYIDWIKKQPELIYPETKDATYEVPDLPTQALVENEVVNDLQHAFRQMFLEAGNSQSAKMPTGLLDHDSDRMGDYMEKCRSLINDYAAGATPQDLPQSSPLRPRTAAGRRGTKVSV